jgi:hypothetical protein
VDEMSLVTIHPKRIRGMKNPWDVVSGFKHDIGLKCHMGKVSQWMFQVGLNVTVDETWVDVTSRHLLLSHKKDRVVDFKPDLFCMRFARSWEEKTIASFSFKFYASNKSEFKIAFFSLCFDSNIFSFRYNFFFALQSETKSTLFFFVLFRF